METPPLNIAVSDPINGAIKQAWAVWLTNLWIMTSSIDDHGTARPTKNLFIGRCFFDETLGLPIWLKSIRPTVWVDATGAAV